MAEPAAAAAAAAAAPAPSAGGAPRPTDVIVYVVGPTGAGKSQLGIDICLHLRKHGRRAEIINADVMQMYAGLPVATNKVTPEEQEGIPHHFLGHLDPIRDAGWTVGNFVDAAVPLIRRLLAEGTVPVVVGGTHYYVQALLFEEALVGSPPPASAPAAPAPAAAAPAPAAGGGADAPPPLGAAGAAGREVDSAAAVAAAEGAAASGEAAAPAAAAPRLPRTVAELAELTDAECHAALRAADPAMAQRLHPNDSRRVRRSLTVWLQEGAPHSAIIAAQRREQLRFPPPLRNVLLWVDCGREALNPRLDGRVDKMLKRGLLEEARGFLAELRAAHGESWEPDGKGLLGAIGWKELVPHLRGEESLDEGLERMKQNTRRYAKQQQQWVRNRFCNRDALAVFRLDSASYSTGGLPAFRADCSAPAAGVVDCALRGGDPAVECAALLFSTEKRDDMQQVGMVQQFTCAPCGNRVFCGAEPWGEHLRSRKHKAAVSREQRRPEVEARKRRSQGAEGAEGGQEPKRPRQGSADADGQPPPGSADAEGQPPAQASG
eukprot:TRINITY_DN19306_c0_g1_i1.p1 TRINITY_DN19306_c0_g1~~TRINITY_DN19306_c0_g1_i1.p1  ORF type:complete len:572 (+),score=167.01 TRINITY_DN19306_c0_g1_i1:75-1718(+)